MVFYITDDQYFKETFSDNNIEKGTVLSTSAFSVFPIIPTVTLFYPIILFRTKKKKKKKRKKLVKVINEENE